MRRRTRRDRRATDVPEPRGPEWISIADARVWLPEEYRKRLQLDRVPESGCDWGGPGWATARSSLSLLLDCTGGPGTAHEVGWVSKVGEGLNKETYRAEVTFREGRRERQAGYAVSQIHRHAEANAGTRMQKELSILDTIGSQTTHISVPEPLGMVWCDGHLLSVTSYVAGWPVELKASKARLGPPWELVGAAAAEVHRLPTSDLPDLVDRFPTRQDHALSRVEGYKSLQVPLIQETLGWILANLPPRRVPVLVHGDLLGQNILHNLENEIFLIDWEYAFIGDPAYDLSIVTRGARRPFGVGGGLNRLLDAYHSAGGQDVSATDVRVYDLLMCIGWYEQSLKRSRGGHSPDHYLDQLRGMLTRARE